jgi:putative restriction endonuclease
MLLTQPQLLELLVQSVMASGWNCLVLKKTKPFVLRIFRDEKTGFDLKAFIWNCTHGGGSARADDEYRIQITGTIPSEDVHIPTVLLGWHSAYEVFAAFDIRRHESQASSSPSMQIKEATLQAAHANAFAIYKRQNGEIAIAFRPQFLVDYVIAKGTLHATGAANIDLTLLNNLGAVTDADVAEISNNKRRLVVSTIVRKYRAADFQSRVLGAYGHKCAMCGVQLEMVDAAHIIPVAADTSNDETRNGIALCKLHHASYDRNLISFDEKYRVEVSDERALYLTQNDRAAGLQSFRENLLPVIRMPYDRRDYPPATYIAEARRVRRWVT